MNYRRVFLVSAILVFTIPAFAQDRRHPGMQSGGAPGRPAPSHPAQGQQHHMVTPEMLEHHMMQQFWHEQLMLNEMFSTPRMERRQPQPNQRGGQTQTKTNQPQRRESTGAKSITADRRPQAQSGSAAPRLDQSNETRSTRDRRAEEKSKERYRRDLPSRKARERDAGDPRMLQLGPDHAAISLLRTVHERLQKADADYAGHRRRAMEHTMAALRQLRAPAGLDAILLVSAGSRPQWESDQILRDAMRSLNRAEGMLGTGANVAAHHHSARTSVAAAVRELQNALRIR